MPPLAMRFAKRVRFNAPIRWTIPRPQNAWSALSSSSPGESATATRKKTEKKEWSFYQPLLISCLAADASVFPIESPYRPAGFRHFCSVPRSKRWRTTVHSTASFSTKTTGTEHGNEMTEESRLNTAKDRIGAAKDRGATAAREGTAMAKKGAVGVRDLMKKYGWTFMGTYFALYLSVVSSFFVGIDSGLVDPAIMLSFIKGGALDAASETKSSVEILVQYLEKYEWLEPYARAMEKNPHTANFGIAWFLTKFTEPLRLGASIALVPRVHKALGRSMPSEEAAPNNDSKERKDSQ